MTDAARSSRRFVRWSIAAVTACALMGFTPSADAAITSVFTATPAPIPCAVQGSGVRLCDQTIAGNPGGTARSTVKTFDGVPIDVRVAFPPEPVSGPDGPYPLIMMFHGYAGSKLSLTSMQPFLNAGYATFSMTTRGFGQSCGTTAARSADPAGCTAGHVRLMDTRYEVRDAQELAGLLADESRTSFTQIGAIGGSYGGGMSMALAALKNRKMLPDGSLSHGRARRHADADRGGHAGDPVDRPGVLAGAQRPHARLRRRRALRGPHRGPEVVLGERALQHRPRVASTRRPAPIRTPTCATGTSPSTTASPTTTGAATRCRRSPTSATSSPRTTRRTTSTTRKRRRRC